MSTRIACTIALPPGFRHHDVLAFHRRDAQQVAERVEAAALHKGLAWGGHPACLSVRFDDALAEVALAVDGPVPPDTAALERMARRMLGLTQAVERFEHQYASHPQLGALIAANAGLRVPQTATPFEALTWAITGQQISVTAAVSVRRQLILAAGQRHGGGLYCYPDASRIARLDEDALRGAGFSRTKARTLLSLSALVARGELPLDDWADAPPVDLIRSRLIAVRGIGPWTVSYTLLRGYAALDGSLHGDVAVRNKLQQLLDLPERLSEAETERWLAQFAPWRALVAAHLWAMGSGAALIA
jgi:DNA-3-methyladenine glycosylase II